MGGWRAVSQFRQRLGHGGDDFVSARGKDRAYPRIPSCAPREVAATQVSPGGAIDETMA